MPLEKVLALFHLVLCLLPELVKKPVNTYITRFLMWRECLLLHLSSLRNRIWFVRSSLSGDQYTYNSLQTAGSQGAIDDGGSGIATFTVTCNGAGTGWEALGLIVTAVECSAVPGQLFL